MNTVVCDTGPIIHLKEAGLLKLLKETGKIYIPQMVETELSEIDPQHLSGFQKIFYCKLRKH